ncbi:MAG TPA: DUF4062 domain-containing protein [Vicinamibacterales bacterium]|nr:DUF4062 domain-containing protein [Vicinamibacterales bacterium]
MKVFISSIVQGLEPLRDAAARAVKILNYEVVRAEDFNARADSPQPVCLAGVRAADVTVLILGGRYGEPQGAQGLSPTHEEYREARDHGRVLAFIQEDVSPEPRQEAFIREVQQWLHGQFTARFSSAEELRDAVTTALHHFELNRRAGPVDEAEVVGRARSLLQDSRGISSPRLAVALSGGPRQEVLRPGQLESNQVVRTIQQEAMFGQTPVLDPESATTVALRNGRLVLQQDEASILLTALGDLRIVQAVQRLSEGGTYFAALVEEEVEEDLERAIRFGGWLLDNIDSPRRLSSIAVVGSIMNGGYLGWMTSEEKAKSRGAIVVGTRGEATVSVELTPPVRPRAALLASAKVLAEDLTVLLRRELKT